MDCEFKLCLYNQNEQCLLTRVRIDYLGACESYEMVNIRAEILNEYKQRRLRQTAESWARMDDEPPE